jgi:hypothetical protein
VVERSKKIYLDNLKNIRLGTSRHFRKNKEKISERKK